MFRSSSHRVLTAVVASFACLMVAAEDAPAQSPHEMSQAEFERLVEDLSNWGRWGKDDQLGTVNLITPEKRLAALGVVEKGVSVPLGHPAETREAPDNPMPFQHTMITHGGSDGQWAMDNYSVAYHGFAHTHMDSLCHLFYNGRMYNGFKREQVGPKGADQLGIDNFRDGILTRGILVDIPRLRGVRFLEPGAPIFPEDLDAWEKETGLKVQSGDVLFIRTGRWARRAVTGPWNAQEGVAGLHASCVKWLHERDIAMLGSDAAADVIPSGIDGVTHPVHVLTLYSMGTPIFDNCDLEAVAETAARLNRWEFLLTASPLIVDGGTGSPLNPIATF